MSEASHIVGLVDRRYGGLTPGPLPEIAEDAARTINVILRHRSVRSFSDRPIDDEHIRLLVAAAQSAPTSSNNQVWSVVAVRDRATIRELVRSARVSAFARAVPVILVFVADWSRALLLSREAGVGSAGAEYLESTLVAFVDAGIAAQTAAIAAEAVGLGTCFLGSIRNEPAAVASLLNLPVGAVAVAGLALGHPVDAVQTKDLAAVKPRLPQRVVLHYEHYQEHAAYELALYDDSLAAHYARHGRDQAPWTAEIAGRVRDADGLHGRHTMRADLEARGLPSC